MRIIIRLTIAFVILSTVFYFGYRLIFGPFEKIAPPANPPFFSVTYSYFFNTTKINAGITIGKEIDEDIANIKKAGFEGVKINFAFGQNNLLSDKIANVVARNGMYTIGQFIGHNTKPKERAFTEDELTQWENFVRFEVKRNKNTIYYWEVWNEPAMTELRFRYGTPTEYLELLRRTEKIIREENPLAKIIVTVDASDRETTVFTNEFLTLGGDKYFDYLSFHPYNNNDSAIEETVFKNKMAKEINLVKEYKLTKPLWISEIGCPDSETSEEGQAQRALMAFKTAYENKIPIIWLHYSDRRLPAVDGKRGWGLVREDNTLKPSYEAIKSFISGLKKTS